MSFSSDFLKPLNISAEAKMRTFKKSYLGMLLEKINPGSKKQLTDIYLAAPDFPLVPLGRNTIFIHKPYAIIDKGLFIGEIKDNNLNGVGYFIDINGNYYEGYFSNGKYHGNGRLFTIKDEIITSDWVNGICTYGTILKFNEKIYEGNIKNLEAHGIGQEKGIDYVYNGSFFESKKHGKGKVVWADGNWYEGEFYMGKIEGIGKYHWAESEYEGSWKADKMHGQGKQVWNDGRVYEGGMHKGLRHGFGIFKSKSKTYTGYWENGKEDGIGTMINNGEIIEGVWNNGRFLAKDLASMQSSNRPTSPIAKKTICNIVNFSNIKIPKKIRFKCEQVLALREVQGQVDWDNNEDIFVSENSWKKIGKGHYYGETSIRGSPNGRGIWISLSQIYEGYFIEGDRNGFGRQINCKNEVYTGHWVKGVKHGFGVFTKPKANYIGDWENDTFHGQGVLITDTTVYDGSWDNGLQHGQGALKYTNQRIYKGDFFQGIVQGIGIIIYPDGHGYMAKWADGECRKVLKKFRSEKDFEKKQANLSQNSKNLTESDINSEETEVDKDEQAQINVLKELLNISI
ncbi:hypothetical protein SteCoe_4053 [Stentor coeruleus]|uniref:Uncharacterized protein n=1 Tax=Stentor coeruleus TaxID=5963 RepID=A0A1R2CVU9_9CILI|nr:hypothetical protein SteCoe_4053 [Stentor coeruleus]